MAVYKQGSRGGEVNQIQKFLSEAGYNVGPIDGIYGPKTAKAVREYQQANGLTVDGIVGPQTWGSMGFDGAASDPDTVPASDEIQGTPRMNLPGEPVLIEKDGEDWLVYTVPGTEDDPIYLGWKSPTKEDTQSFFGPGQPIVYGQLEGDIDDILDFGTTDELANFTSDPFATWSQTLATEAQTQPWILDPDYQSLMAMALMEGRALTDAEIQTTDWWQNHTEEEREWMRVYHGDPLTAEQRLQDGRSDARQSLIQAGAGMDIPDEVVDFMADKLTMGHWSSTFFTDQIVALTDPYAGINMDTDLAVLVDGISIGTTNQSEDLVRGHLRTWLGPLYGDWSEDEIRSIAGQMRNDPTYEQKFIEQLKDQRMAMFPEYTDRNMSYQAISQPWKQYAFSLWGQQPDETSDTFVNVVKMNDTQEAGRLLRQEGLKQGVEKVERDLQTGIIESIGGTLRRGL